MKMSEKTYYVAASIRYDGETGDYLITWTATDRMGWSKDFGSEEELIVYLNLMGVENGKMLGLRVVDDGNKTKRKI